MNHKLNVVSFMFLKITLWITSIYHVKVTYEKRKVKGAYENTFHDLSSNSLIVKESS